MQNLGKGIDDEGEVVEIAQPPEEPVKPTVKEEKPDKMLKSCGFIVSPPSLHDAKQDGMIKEFGRLVVDEGRSRYVSNKFWNSLSEEVSCMFGTCLLDRPVAKRGHQTLFERL